MSKTIYDLTPSQAHVVAMFALNFEGSEMVGSEVGVETPIVLENGLSFEVSFRCWQGEIVLFQNKGNIQLTDDEGFYQKIPEENLDMIELYLVREGIWS